MAKLATAAKRSTLTRGSRPIGEALIQTLTTNLSGLPAGSRRSAARDALGICRAQLNTIIQELNPKPTRTTRAAAKPPAKPTRKTTRKATTRARGGRRATNAKADEITSNQSEASA